MKDVDKICNTHIITHNSHTCIGDKFSFFANSLNLNLSFNGYSSLSRFGTHIFYLKYALFTLSNLGESNVKSKIEQLQFSFKNNKLFKKEDILVKKLNSTKILNTLNNFMNIKILNSDIPNTGKNRGRLNDTKLTLLISEIKKLLLLFDISNYKKVIKKLLIEKICCNHLLKTHKKELFYLSNIYYYYFREHNFSNIDISSFIQQSLKIKRNGVSAQISSLFSHLKSNITVYFYFKIFNKININNNIFNNLNPKIVSGENFIDIFNIQHTDQFIEIISNGMSLFECYKNSLLQIDEYLKNINYQTGDILIIDHISYIYKYNDVYFSTFRYVSIPTISNNINNKYIDLLSKSNIVQFSEIIYKDSELDIKASPFDNKIVSLCIFLSEKVMNKFEKNLYFNSFLNYRFSTGKFDINIENILNKNLTKFNFKDIQKISNTDMEYIKYTNNNRPKKYENFYYYLDLFTIIKSLRNITEHQKKSDKYYVNINNMCYSLLKNIIYNFNITEYKKVVLDNVDKYVDIINKKIK